MTMRLALINCATMNVTVFSGRTPLAVGAIEITDGTTREGLLEVIEAFRTYRVDDEGIGGA